MECLCWSYLFLIWEHFNVSVVNFNRITLAAVRLTVSLLRNCSVASYLEDKP